ncbi:hypothetical protein P1P68_02255 [Streptomyces scabiei]|uniref:hypothetical protein n=1 Tax=Streptomyces scabiei TaxID=1930 RepID=UPI00298FAFF0|nr:hypothetical protein [Streptomyces scabiei]MDW8803657.1 hypothetical protein [Streptomyces scabiei]
MYEIGRVRQTALAARIAVETAAERNGADADELAYLAPAAAAALNLLSDAIKHGADQDDIVQRLVDAGVPEAFALVMDAAAEATRQAADDPYDIDYSLRSDNLSAAASSIRDSFLHI